MTLDALTRRQFGIGSAGALCLAALPGMARAAPKAGARPWPYLIGADVSWIPEDEAAGATYYEDAKRKDPLAIFRDAGFNAIKLRLFVDPANGYSKDKPGGPWCDLPRTIDFAKRIKAADFHLSVTLHYSDTWADPQHQNKPAAWANLPFLKLVEAVHRHTDETFAAMKAAGVAPDLAILGNETTFGMLWPDGRVPLTIPTGNPVTDKVHMNVLGAGGYDKFAALLKAGIAATRAQLPGTPIALHNHLGRHWPIVQYWTDNLISRGVDFDALGFSCYQQAAQGDWERTFTEFGRRYPDKGFFAIEYSSRKRYLNDLIHAHPNGWGSFIWEPTRHQEAIFLMDGRNAGEGPRPDLLSQGLNAAEAPGATPPSGPVASAAKSENHGGRYDADPAFLQLYRQMARDYGVLK
ncbi:arabinogalactan endo-1,4-beta-galactosidase [Novosphingobium sp. PhB165]|uniref:glycosyl hydrolase 53 family protein n=1 Tax=Novosphingobium sp. PhB165 TaxID=2485105 RepID=UPI0010DE352D|nr:glycosyl hydrolase 53 family protein [Novosphingobium sp. PhB165]TCM15432.1 arabinogalactan endo-1,4-beta-galactosidase [Novosphingobium sp. PhB165]